MKLLKLIPLLVLGGALTACGGDSGRQLPVPPTASSSSSSSSVAASSSSTPTSSAAASSSSAQSSDDSSSEPSGPDFDFEEDTVGEAPVGLLVNEAAPTHALVSDEQAFNGSKSLKLIKPTAGQNAYGRYVMDAPVGSGSLSVAVFVSADASGQTLVTLFGGDWSGANNRLIDVVFHTDGNLRVRPTGVVGGTAPSPINTGTVFTFNAWHVVDITWDDIALSNEFTLRLNGTLVGTHPVALIAGLEPDRLELKYGQSGAGTYVGSAYFDDIYLPELGDVGGGSSSEDSSSSEEASSSSEEASSSSEEASSSSSAGAAPDFDFESDTDTLGSAPTGFTLVDGAMVVVSDDQANTGLWSLRVDKTVAGHHRVRKNLTTTPTGSFRVAVYIPTDADIDTFVTLFDNGGAAADKAFELLFKPDGEIRRREGTGQVWVGANYVADAWNLIEITWENLATGPGAGNTFSLSVNGSNLGSFAAANDDKVPDRFVLSYGNQNDISATAASVYFDTVFGF